MNRLLLSLLISLPLSVGGQTPPPLLTRPPEGTVVLSSEQAKQTIISGPTPEYPIEARRRHLTGKGVSRLNISQQTGAVTSIDVLTSTGHDMLDRAAVKTLKMWKVRPNGMIGMKVPIEFSMPAHATAKKAKIGK